MSDDVLSPININAKTWLYAEKRWLVVMRQIHDEKGHLLQTEQITIPWAKIRKALALSGN